VAVIETGLGGRLDSTNIIKPVLSVITNIGHDHMDLLGDTIEKIAKEKAGIIKPGVPVVISETDTSTMELFVRKAGECDAEILFADTICNCHLDKTYDSNELRSFRIIMNGNDSYSGTVPLGGDYQAKNIQAVFAIFRMLNERFKISIDQVLKGIAEVKRNTGLRGRWEILRYNPLVIADTGHNREGLEYVISQLTALNKTRLHIVVGFVADKDLASVLPLFPAEAEYYFTRARAQRALDQDTLKREAGKYGLHGDSYPDVKSAMDSALLRASPSDLIFIGGSTYIVAEVI
jgi:dihydrofolate synthase/folylpolyglutamate synthase